MYKVALCEDEQIFSNAQQQICRVILDKLNIEYQISLFASGEDFLTDCSGGQKQYDLILLDIMMDGIDGMALARKIRETDKNAVIIFVTSSPEYALQGYDVNALHYLVKPLDGSVLERLITSDYQKRFQAETLVVRSGTKNLKVLIKDIICLETVGRKVEITSLNGVMTVAGKLSDFLESHNRLIRCHKGFAVNIANIRELRQTEMIAVNEKKIPVSRTYVKDVRRMFFRRMRNE